MYSCFKICYLYTRKKRKFNVKLNKNFFRIDSENVINSLKKGWELKYPEVKEFSMRKNYNDA